jgi:hypothetical protein
MLHPADAALAAVSNGPAQGLHIPGLAPLAAVRVCLPAVTVALLRRAHVTH